ncbi:MAG: YicC family protein [Betaproteobacteria bacterium]|nr:YicC family protein [Betaproteobacteria bacterium]
MTGYAQAVAELPAGNLSLELRAVNSRFLELNFRMGEEFRSLDPALRERIGDKVKRGKLECRINFNANEGAGLPDRLDGEVLAKLARLSEQALQALPDARPLSAADILRWPGILGQQTLDIEALQATLLKLLDQALADFNQSRAREGDKLKAVLLDRVGAIRKQVATLRPKAPAIVAAYQEKLTRRIEELMASPDPERLMQEVALFAQKADVDEELDRLETHLTEVERVLSAGGAAGKRLDFLMQELNREANTLGSKAAANDLSQTAVELKVLIEQMREQIQNIE